jgi:hypothetical protein
MRLKQLLDCVEENNTKLSFILKSLGVKNQDLGKLFLVFLRFTQTFEIKHILTLRLTYIQPNSLLTDTRLTAATNFL